MAGSQDDEELEPLFDYSRVQPADFIDIDGDDDCSGSPPVTRDPKRKSCSGAIADEEHEVVLLDGDAGQVHDEEEDWLPPPPPAVAGSTLELEKDKTVQELRLKRQELASFTQSADEVIRAVIESAKKELNSLGSPDDLEVEETVKTKADRPKILISIQDKDGNKQFRVFKDDKFEKLFKMYANRTNRKVECLVFCFDGGKVNPSSTPNCLGLEDEDIIEVHLKSQ